jgi:hypothetical protein
MVSDKVLFILKRRHDFNPIKHSPRGLSTGLFNSASFMVDILRSTGIDSAIEVAIDNNCIDRLVTEHHARHVVIEAFWVVPSKFAQLVKLHPHVRWYIRVHSEMPFLAGEGMAMDWLGEYVNFPSIYIGVNAPRMLRELRMYLSIKQGWTEAETYRRVLYMPNWYPPGYKTKSFNRDRYWIDIACFGAVRPLKNHLLQAYAAIQFAESRDKQLRFHINGGRIEQKGDSVLHNLKGLFQHLSGRGHQMIMHDWRPRDQFLELCGTMDIGMQCNMSETFNIVGADLISQGVPLVGSAEIPWTNRYWHARAQYSDEMVRALDRAYRWPKLNVWLNQRNLDKYCKQTQQIWADIFGRD